MISYGNPIPNLSCMGATFGNDSGGGVTPPNHSSGIIYPYLSHEEAGWVNACARTKHEVYLECTRLREYSTEDRQTDRQQLHTSLRHYNMHIIRLWENDGLDAESTDLAIKSNRDGSLRTGSAWLLQGG